MVLEIWCSLKQLRIRSSLLLQDYDFIIYSILYQNLFCSVVESGVEFNL